MLKQRYRRILWFFAIILLNMIWWEIILPKIGLRRLARRGRAERFRRVARNFRDLAVQMGGVMIKVGQFLSSRLDVLPREITDELAGLQDEVQPETFENIKGVAEAEFNASLEEKFCYFEETPMAAASIGQVHRAHLCPEPGQTEPPPVVVKIQRPNILEIVEIDLKAIRVVGGWLKFYRPISKRADVPALIEEFSRVLHEEIDYINEGKNAEKFAENFSDRSNVQVPSVNWDFTTRRVLTLQDVQTIKITDYAAIESAGIDRAEVAERLLGTYLKQIFEDRFFHADPHPGNLFVFPAGNKVEGERRDWKLVFVDFGMTGQVTDNLYEGLRELLIALGTRDAARVIKAYQEMDVLLPGTDLDLLQKATSRVFRVFWGKSTPQMMEMHKEEAQKFLDEFGDLLYEMPFQIPENLILLGRCLGILSGMCSGLDPNFNIWTSISPYAAKLIEGEKGTGWQTWLKEAGVIFTSLLGLPRGAETVLDIIEQGELEIRTPSLTHQITRLDQTFRKLIGAIIFSAFLLVSGQLFLGGQVYVAGAMAIIALFIALWILFSH
ncbi:MAG: AarF/UbiB family protein [Anaerolineaceae bacterium]|jgi:predicted unusual protein kinase regulating ubiquinone biosynthesis (AarF/ABC1/UbiB family)